MVGQVPLEDLILVRVQAPQPSHAKSGDRETYKDMNYVLIILIIVTFVLHWHYYRWSVFNDRVNYPIVYRSKFGISLVIISKIILFSIVVLFYNWYYVLVLIAVFFILKLAMGYFLIPHETKEWAKSQKISEAEAREIVSRIIKERYRKSSKLI